MPTQTPAAVLEQLDILLSGSRAAETAYRQALERAEKGHVQETTILRKLLRDHAGNGGRLSYELHRLGGNPKGVAPAFEGWRRIAAGVTSLFRGPGPLRALKSGEVHELARLRGSEALLDPYCGSLLRDILIPSYLGHVLALDGLIGRAATPPFLLRPSFGME